MGSADLPAPVARGGLGVSAGVRLLVAGGAGLVAGTAGALVQNWRYGLLLAWIAAAAVFVTWTWCVIGPMDAEDTARHAVREDAGRRSADLTVVGAALASLLAVALLLTSGASKGAASNVQAALSLGSIALAWTAVHTMYATRYARIYYTGTDGGVDFNSDAKPCYSDFAYVSFTIGMAYAVSDTNLTTPVMRSTALRHALLSFLFGTGIIATTINLVAGLAG